VYINNTDYHRLFKIQLTLPGNYTPTALHFLAIVKI